MTKAGSAHGPDPTPPPSEVDTSAAGRAGGETIRQGGETRSTRVESLRAVAALGVLVYHLVLVNYVGRAAVSRPVALLAVSGLGGLYLFFSLSGYLIFRPFARRDFAQGGPVDIRRYMINRAVRLLPLYYGVTVILLVVADQSLQPNWWRFVTMTWTYSSQTVDKLDGPAWSVVVELQFYVLLPLIALLIAALGGRSTWRAIAVVAALGALSLVVYQVTYRLHHAEIWRVSFPANFVYFTPGMILALLEPRWRSIASHLPGWASSSTLWLLLGILIWPLLNVAAISAWIPLVAAFLTVGACVLPLNPGLPRRALNWKPLAVVGVASYSLYLWHYPVLQALSSHGWLHFGFIVDGLIAAAVCIAVALASYRVIEEPWLRLRRRWAKTTLEAQAGATAPVVAT